MEICELCGGTNIQAKYWVDLNSKKVKDLVPPLKGEAVWCCDCEQHVDTKQGKINFSKKEAIELMEKGIKMTHVSYSEEEWSVIKNNRYEFEDGCRCSFKEFWGYRTSLNWEDNWSIFKSK